MKRGKRKETDNQEVYEIGEVKKNLFLKTRLSKILRLKNF